MSTSQKVSKVAAKVGWGSFAVYIVSSLCGAEKIAAVSGLVTTVCAITCNGIAAAKEISEIITE